jgi:hypothetical protein
MDQRADWLVYQVGHKTMANTVLRACATLIGLVCGAETTGRMARWPMAIDGPFPSLISPPLAATAGKAFMIDVVVAVVPSGPCSKQMDSTVPATKIT